MISILSVWHFFPRDLNSIFFTFIVSCLVFYITRFYWRVYQLPPGPFPFPIIGNLWSLMRRKNHMIDEMDILCEKYGPVFTLWYAWNPIVIIGDIDIGKEVYNKHEFSGVGYTFSPKVQGYDFKAGQFGVAFNPISPEWETMRKILYSVVQKYTNSDFLLYHVSECVDKTVKKMVEKEGTDKPFLCYEYLNNMTLNISSRMFFGKWFDLNDPNINELYEFSNKLNSRMFLWNLSPLLTSMDRNYRKLTEKTLQFFEIMRNEFQSHYSDYNPMITRDFCDALITAKMSYIKRNEHASFLTDNNLTLSIFDVWLSTSDTTEQIFQWILHYMLSLPEMHLKLKKEIESQIGDRIPTLEDRNRCHYNMAFISEVLRIRNTNGPEFHHASVANSKIDKYEIPKGTSIHVYLPHILRSDKYWPMSKQFRPERFLHNGKYMTTRPKAFIPFGVGRRMCVGDKLSTNILFIALVRFIQKTAEYKLVLHSSGDSKPDTNFQFLVYTPKEFRISFDSKNE